MLESRAATVVSFHIAAAATVNRCPTLDSHLQNARLVKRIMIRESSHRIGRMEIGPSLQPDAQVTPPTTGPLGGPATPGRGNKPYQFVPAVALHKMGTVALPQRIPR